MTTETLLSPNQKADIQGFITSGYGHLPFGAYLFVELRDRVQARAWLNNVCPRLTSAVSWRVRPDAPKAKPERALNIALSYSGLGALGLSQAALHTFPPEFREGMATESRMWLLGDTGTSAPSNWELGGPMNPPIHAMLMLFAQTQADLDKWCAEEREALQAMRGVIEHKEIAQYGARPEHGGEPFGFFDGVAQPIIRGIKGKGVSTGEFILGYLNEYGFYPVSPVVPAADDPEHILPKSANPYHKSAGYRDLGFNGSYVIYRKMEQDVAAFWHFLRDESIRVQGTADPRFMVWLAAKMVGRWPSGAPLVLAPDADNAKLRTDDYFYAGTDPEGLACPFGSHIRRTNPRDQIGRTGPTESLHMSKRHRILRRGKPYGPPLFDPIILTRTDQPEALRALLDLQDDGQARGVHFFCANANIKSQFEFVQQAWVNNPTFDGLIGNRDPLVGNNDPVAAPGGMLVPGLRATLHSSPLPRFVTVRGGAYLFMPSMTTLRYLAQGL